MDCMKQAPGGAASARPVMVSCPGGFVKGRFSAPLSCIPAPRARVMSSEPSRRVTNITGPPPRISSRSPEPPAGAAGRGGAGENLPRSDAPARQGAAKRNPSTRKAARQPPMGDPQGSGNAAQQHHLPAVRGLPWGAEEGQVGPVGEFEAGPHLGPLQRGRPAPPVPIKSPSFGAFDGQPRRARSNWAAPARAAQLR